MRVIGRRQIEMYSRLIHTVDHIEGRLREDMDAFDAFLSHAWAVTVTGAPKLWAMRFIEQNEKSPRAWYGGAIGMVQFQRRHEHRPDAAHHPHQGRHRRGARRRHTAVRQRSRGRRSRNRTEGIRHALRHPRRQGRQCRQPPSAPTARVGDGVNILLVDHEDSFVHTLANYFRQTGANVSTVRTPVPEEVFDRLKPDLVVLSPGPGTPKDFDCAATIKKARARDLPIFGVCLGLQALAEAYGGELRQLHVPMHGKPSRIRVSKPGIIFSGLPKEVTVGRYHSIFADPVRLPDDFIVTAETEDGIIMAFEHTQGADRRGAVPSGIDHDARPQCRHAHDRERRRAPAAQGQGKGGLTAMAEAENTMAIAAKAAAKQQGRHPRLLVDRHRLRRARR